MTNLKFIQTLTAGVALATVLYPQAWATEYVACGNKTGDTNSNCWSCGETCSARFDSSSHTITFSGSGDMTPDLVGDSKNAPWESIGPQIHSVVIEEGITSVPRHTFNTYLHNTRNITSVSLPSTLTSIGGAAFAIQNTGSLGNLVVPENVTTWGGNVFYATRGHIYCSASQMNNCLANSDYSNATFSSYEKINGLYYIYDSEGNVDEIYDSFNNFKSNVKLPVDQRLSQKDEDGNITVYDDKGNIAAKYSAEGVLTQYDYNADGSISVYTDGKLTGLKNAKSITPAQAAALIKKCNCNTVKLTFK